MLGPGDFSMAGGQAQGGNADAVLMLMAQSLGSNAALPSSSASSLKSSAAILQAALGATGTGSDSLASLWQSHLQSGAPMGDLPFSGPGAGSAAHGSTTGLLEQWEASLGRGIQGNRPLHDREMMDFPNNNDLLSEQVVGSASLPRNAEELALRFGVPGLQWGALEGALGVPGAHLRSAASWPGGPSADGPAPAGSLAAMAEAQLARLGKGPAGGNGALPRGQQAEAFGAAMGPMDSALSVAYSNALRGLRQGAKEPMEAGAGAADKFAATAASASMKLAKGLKGVDPAGKSLLMHQLGRDAGSLLEYGVCGEDGARGLRSLPEFGGGGPASGGASVRNLTGADLASLRADFTGFDLSSLLGHGVQLKADQAKASRAGARVMADALALSGLQATATTARDPGSSRSKSSSSAGKAGARLSDARLANAEFAQPRARGQLEVGQAVSSAQTETEQTTAQGTSAATGHGGAGATSTKTEGSRRSEPQTEQEKRLRKLALNREAARRMRKRQAMRLEELEKTVLSLQTANLATKNRLKDAEKKIVELEMKNEKLEERVVSVAGAIVSQESPPETLKEKVAALVNSLSPEALERLPEPLKEFQSSLGLTQGSGGLEGVKVGTKRKTSPAGDPDDLGSWGGDRPDGQGVKVDGHSVEACEDLEITSFDHLPLDVLNGCSGGS